MPTSTISTSCSATTTASVFNRFKTFTQELRLQGEAFDGRLDWLVGGYYANEKLRVDDNLAYGAGLCALCELPGGGQLRGSPRSDHPGAGRLPYLLQSAVATGVRAALLGQYNAALGAGQFTTAANLGSNITALGAFAQLNNTLGPGIPWRPVFHL